MTIVPELKDELVRIARAGHAPAAVPPLRPRRPWHRGSLPLIVAGVLAASGAATGAGFVVSSATTAKSARLADAPKPTTGPFSRLGSQLVATAKSVQAGLPYPPGMHDDYDWSKYSMGATLGSGGEVRSEVEMMSESRAQCLWRRYYLQAHDAHDIAGMRAAATILEESHHWPATARMTAGESITNVPFAAFDAAAQHGQVAAGGRNQVEINCYDHTKAELTGKVPLVHHSGT